MKRSAWALLALLCALSGWPGSDAFEGDALKIREALIHDGIIPESEVQRCSIDKPRILHREVVLPEGALGVVSYEAEGLFIAYHHVRFQPVSARDHSHHR